MPQSTMGFTIWLSMHPRNFWLWQNCLSACTMYVLMSHLTVIIFSRCEMPYLLSPRHTMEVFNLILDVRVMLNNDSCQKRIVTDQCHMTVSWALVYNSMLLLLFFFKVLCDQSLVFNWSQAHQVHFSGEIQFAFSLSGHLILHDCVIWHNWPQIASDRTIWGKSHNSLKNAKFK